MPMRKMTREERQSVVNAWNEGSTNRDGARRAATSGDARYKKSGPAYVETFNKLNDAMLPWLTGRMTDEFVAILYWKHRDAIVELAFSAGNCDVAEVTSKDCLPKDKYADAVAELSAQMDNAAGPFIDAGYDPDSLNAKKKSSALVIVGIVGVLAVIATVAANRRRSF